MLGAPDRDDDVARARLLERAGRACWLVDQVHDAVRLLDRASALVDPATEPLWACRIALVRRDLAWSLGEVDDFIGGDIEAIVEVSRADKSSREHAEALAAWARSLYEGDARRGPSRRRGGTGRGPPLALSGGAGGGL